MRFTCLSRRTRERMTRLRRIKTCRQLALTEHPFALIACSDIMGAAKLPLTRADFPRALIGTHAERGEILVRQLLLHLLGSRVWVAAGLDHLSNGRPIRMPLPSTWITALEAEGFRFDRHRCGLHLWLFSAYQLILGLGALARRLLRGWRPANGSARPQAAFDSLTPASLPAASAAGDDVISWYRRSDFAKDDASPIWVSLSDVDRPSSAERDLVVVPSLLPLPEGKAFWRFTGQALRASLVAAWGLLRGRWWQALMLREAIQRTQLENLPGEWLPRQIFFHGSNYLLRPLWTYAAERRGCRTSLMFYSTNSGRMQIGGRHWTPQAIGYRSMSWGHMLAWDKYHATLLRQYSPDADIKITGALAFNDSLAAIPEAPRPRVAIFDVQALRKSFLTASGLPFTYYESDVVNAFLRDSVAASEAASAGILWKVKRDVGSLSAPQYARLCEQLALNPRVISVDPAISAWRVIGEADAVISIPFTSTAVIAKEMGKPSAYYDASGCLGFETEAAHGLPVLRNPSELRDWLFSALAGSSTAAACPQCPANP